MSSHFVFTPKILGFAVFALILQGCGSDSDPTSGPGISTIAVSGTEEPTNESTVTQSDDNNPDPADENYAESRCGPGIDWQPVESYDRSKWPTASYVSTNESQVGRLKGYPSQLSCSGTLIAPDLFLTAGHCVTPQSTFQQIEMNYQDKTDGTPRDIEWFNVTEVVEDELAGLDYAILRVEGNPGYRFGMTTPLAKDVGAGTQLALIQHPTGIRKVIDAGTAQGSSGSQLYYGDIDTLGGSSGSGVLDNEGNLVAVHSLGGCDTRGVNSGVLIRDIAKVSPVLKSLTSRVCHMKPIARYWNPVIKDHFYSQVFEPSGFWGYNFERYEYSVCKNPTNGTVPYQQWWGNSNHYYTVDHSTDVQYVLALYGYEYEGVQGQVHTSAMNGSVPLYRYWNEELKDHFYTIDKIPDGTYGYHSEHTEAYVFRQ